VTHITHEEIHQAYEQAKLFYDEKISIKETVANLPTLKPSTVKDFVYNYRQMRDGLVYQRGISSYAMRYFLEGIQREHGVEALAIALASVKAHLEYNKHAGMGKWELYEEFLEKLGNHRTPSLNQVAIPESSYKSVQQKLSPRITASYIL
jgi:hypothetical protein